jgi:hypothetical protein
MPSLVLLTAGRSAFFNTQRRLPPLSFCRATDLLISRRPLPAILRLPITIAWCCKARLCKAR